MSASSEIKQAELLIRSRNLVVIHFQYYCIRLYRHYIDPHRHCHNYISSRQKQKRKSDYD